MLLVQARLAPNVEDAVFMAGDWLLTWAEADEGPELRRAVLRRKNPRGGAT